MKFYNCYTIMAGWDSCRFTRVRYSQLSTVAYALVHNCLIRSGQLSVIQPILFLIGDCGVAAKINVHGQLPRKTLTKWSVCDGYDALQEFPLLYRIDGSQCLLKLAYAFQLLKCLLRPRTR